MAARFLLILLITLIVLGSEIGETVTDYYDQKEEIDSLVRLAVEDTSWLNATTKEELSFFLSRVFSSDLTMQLAEDIWLYFENPTGFLQEAKVIKTRTMVLGQTAYTIASLELYGTGDNTPHLEATGTGFFRLTSKNGRWKIYRMEFDWHYTD